MKTASRPALRRLLFVDRIIREGRFPNATTISEKLEVHARTVHRDLDFLRNSWGAPLHFNREKNGYHYTDADFALPLLRLSEGELLALLLGERLIQEYAGTAMSASLAGLFVKITAALPDEMTIDLSHLRDVYSVRHQRMSSNLTQLFKDLTKAVQGRRQLELVYWTASRDATTRRIVDPYHLASVQGDWYLVAYCHLREEIRMFVPARIRSHKETGQQFDRPAEFRIEEYLDHSFRVLRGDGKPQRVRLCFTPEMARYVRERQWHPSQKMETRKDGSLIVTLQVSHLLEIKRWAMSYGCACEVLEPKELRQEIETEFDLVKQIYRGRKNK